MSGMGLTEQQASLLGFIEGWQYQFGFAPNFPEMAMFLGYSEKSKGAVHRHLKCLEERGYIRRLPKRARAIELLHQGSACPQCGHIISPAAAVRESPAGMPPSPSTAGRGLSFSRTGP